MAEAGARDRSAEDSGKQAEAAREAQARADEEAQNAAKAEQERQQAAKAEARAIAEAAERQVQGRSVEQKQAAAAAAEVAALTTSTAELDSRDAFNAANDNEGGNDSNNSGDDDDDENGGDDEESDSPTESDDDYVEPHIEVPGIPYMAADAHGGSHMEECHRSKTRVARSRLERYFWSGECTLKLPSISGCT